MARKQKSNAKAAKGKGNTAKAQSKTTTKVSSITASSSSSSSSTSISTTTTRGRPKQISKKQQRINEGIDISDDEAESYNESALSATNRGVQAPGSVRLRAKQVAEEKEKELLKAKQLVKEKRYWSCSSNGSATFQLRNENDEPIGDVYTEGQLGITFDEATNPSTRSKSKGKDQDKLLDKESAKPGITKQNQNQSNLAHDKADDSENDDAGILEGHGLGVGVGKHQNKGGKAISNTQPKSANSGSKPNSAAKAAAAVVPEDSESKPVEIKPDEEENKRHQPALPEDQTSQKYRYHMRMQQCDNHYGLTFGDLDIADEHKYHLDDKGKKTGSKEKRGYCKNCKKRGSTFCLGCSDLSSLKNLDLYWLCSRCQMLHLRELHVNAVCDEGVAEEA